MDISFVKMHGTGNDFVFVEDLSDELKFSEDAVKRVCDRHFGIGADGVILVKPPVNEDSIALMYYINSDGSLAQMCGNGIRCFSKYLADNKLALPDEDTFKVDTLSGQKTVMVKRDGKGLVSEVRVDMGKPTFSRESLPCTLEYTMRDHETGCVIADSPIETPAGLLDYTCVSMGNPHAVTFIDDPATFDVQKVGSYVGALDIFPEGTNVEFAHVDKSDDDHACISMRVFERGCGETLACGTGCCATAVAACMTDRAPRKATLKILGGQLEIEWGEDDHVYMTGPATTVFKGCLDSETLGAPVTMSRKKPGCHRA